MSFLFLSQKKSLVLLVHLKIISIKSIEVKDASNAGTFAFKVVVVWLVYQLIKEVKYKLAKVDFYPSRAGHKS